MVCVLRYEDTHSGSRYPGVPATTDDTYVSFPMGKDLESPKSANLAWNCWSKSMLVVLISLWTIGGLHPVCKYSNPT